MSTDFKRRQIVGRGIPLPGNDIDTDRIIPARFLKAVTFASMGEHAFEDARKQNPEHPFNSPAYQGASVLVVGQNFGCGSSREHAPQALMRWGIHAIVGGSFGEIFFGNCTTNGIPCLAPSRPTSNGSSARWAGARASRSTWTSSGRRFASRAGRSRPASPTAPATSWSRARGTPRACCSRRAARSSPPRSAAVRRGLLT